MGVSSPASASRSSFAVKAHSFARSLGSSQLLSRQNLWVWPIVAAILLATIGWFLKRAIEDVIRNELGSELQTLLETDVTALRIWMTTREADAMAAARDPQVREHVRTLLEAEKTSVTPLELSNRPEAQSLKSELAPKLEAGGYNGYIVVTLQGIVIASARAEAVGLAAEQSEMAVALERARQGLSTVLRPMKSRVMLPDRRGEVRAGVPTMFAVAPVQDDAGTTIAMLGLRIPPEQEFTRILSVARAGETGETYAFDREGLLISSSRFEPQLREIGLLTEDADSILNVSLRDPGVDLTAGERPAVPRSQQPLTRMAELAIQGSSGVDVTGYRDYRGVPVIGAWTWLEAHDFGVVAKVDVAEAFQPLYILRRVFFGMFGLLGLAAIAIFAFSLLVARLNRQARIAAIEAKQLGQYHLDQKLGEGGMGVVYRAHHTLLQRPTAVKFLDADKTNEQTIARFEREVQLTSRLNHPNTIAIYDYGRTAEGIFYYAMEYLDGLNLDDLVRRYGPLPDGRVIHLLRQVCGSLHEAHGLGLIHRDIKPANIVLNQRGGVSDVVKLLDFGLVKVLDPQKQASLTSAGGLTGTPMYLSPEAIHTASAVDARSDLYAVGAVGYFLLTGTAVFDGANVLEIIRQHAESPPQAPSERLGEAVSHDLERVLLQCLAKSPSDRPQSARQLADELAGCAMLKPWSIADADRWWRTYRPQTAGNTAADPLTDDGQFQATLLGVMATSS